jgi:anti-sigma-K factor RskA
VTREEKDEQIWLLAAGALDAAEADALRRLLAQGDPADAAAYAEALATVSHLPQSLEQSSPPDAIRQRLLSRVLSDDGASTSSQAPQHQRSRLLPWFAAVAAIAAIVLGFFSMHMSDQLKRHTEEADKTADHLRSQLIAAKRIVAVATVRDLAMVELSSSVTNSPARGRVFWDKDRNQWHVMVFDLAPPPSGREFQLWFITPDQKKISAGMFQVNAKGEGSMIVKIPPDLKQIAVAAITDEPMGGSPQPTGQIQLAGKVE